MAYQFRPVRAGGSEGGWGRAIPIVPGGASMLALRVSTLLNVVRNAAITATTKTVAKTANTVRWVIIGLPHLPIMLDRFLSRGQFFKGIMGFSWAQYASEYPSLPGVAEAVSCIAAA